MYQLPLRYVANHASVDGTSASHRIRIRDDDEWWLLQERDLHVELLWNPLRRNMAVVRPNNVLDVQPGFCGPGAHLMKKILNCTLS